LKKQQKNRDGWSPVPFPPPVSAAGNFSSASGPPEKRVVSKGFTGTGGDRPPRPRAIFVLFSAGFSEGWGLRQFSTHVGLSGISMV
jgi:hypothetical protein